jgi:hypothetical protein
MRLEVRSRMWGEAFEDREVFGGAVPSRGFRDKLRP